MGVSHNPRLASNQLSEEASTSRRKGIWELEGLLRAGLGSLREGYLSEIAFWQYLEKCSDLLTRYRKKGRYSL